MAKVKVGRGNALLAWARFFVSKHLYDAVGCTRGGIGDCAPSAVQGAVGDRVYLRHRTEPLAVRVNHLPVDLNALMPRTCVARRTGRSLTILQSALETAFLEVSSWRRIQGMFIRA